MIFRNILIADANIEPLTDQQALDHLREDPSKIDLVKLYLKAARQSIEAELISLQLTQATYEFQMDDWYSDPWVGSNDPNLGRGVGSLGYNNYLTLPKGPVISITSIKYDDLNNVEQTLGASNYFVDSSSLPGRLQWSFNANLPGSFAKPNSIRIRYVAGYGAPAAQDSGQSAVPAPLKAAILMRLGQIYENRVEELEGRLTPILVGVERLIAPFRIPV